jgi:hypothetical protein
MDNCYIYYFFFNLFFISFFLFYSVSYNKYIMLWKKMSTNLIVLLVNSIESEI